MCLLCFLCTIIVSIFVLCIDFSESNFGWFTKPKAKMFLQFFFSISIYSIKKCEFIPLQRSEQRISNSQRSSPKEYTSPCNKQRPLLRLTHPSKISGDMYCRVPIWILPCHVSRGNSYFHQSKSNSNKIVIYSSFLQFKQK